MAGDSLGFRRDFGLSPSTGQPYALTQHLRYGPEAVRPYPQQLECLLRHGFVLWDIIQSCRRRGSLDQDIRDDVASDVPAFLDQHPGVVRIVLANGGSSSKLFLKHFADWLIQADDDDDDGHDDNGAFSSAKLDFVAGPDRHSQTAFGKILSRRRTSSGPPNEPGTSSTTTANSTQRRTIVLISALSVSPAAASYSYLEKRDFWDEHVYQPGLAMYRDRIRSKR